MALKYLTHNNKLLKSPDGKLLQIDKPDTLGTITVQALEDLQEGDRVFVDTFDHIEDMEVDIPTLPASTVNEACHVKFDGHEMFFMTPASASGAAVLYELIDGVMVKYAGTFTSLSNYYYDDIGYVIRDGNLYFHYMASNVLQWFRVDFTTNSLVLVSQISDSYSFHYMYDHATNPELIYVLRRASVETFNVVYGEVVDTIVTLPSPVTNYTRCVRAMLNPNLFYITQGRGSTYSSMIFATYDRETESIIDQTIHTNLISTSSTPSPLTGANPSYLSVSSLVVGGEEHMMIFSRSYSSASTPYNPYYQTNVAALMSWTRIKNPLSLTGNDSLITRLCSDAQASGNTIIPTTKNLAVGHRRIITTFVPATEYVPCNVYELGMSPASLATRPVDNTSTGSWTPVWGLMGIGTQIARSIYDTASDGNAWNPVGISKDYLLLGKNTTPFFALRKVVKAARKNSEGRAYDYVGFVKNNATAGENVEIEVMFSQTGGMLE